MAAEKLFENEGVAPEPEDAGDAAAKGSGCAARTYSGPYKNYLQNLRSLFYKACRIGDVKRAFLAAEHIKYAQRGGDKYVMRTCLQLLGEDGSPQAAARYGALFWSAIQMAEADALPNHIWRHVVYLCATSEKWYETPDGVELEALRQFTYQKEALPPVDFPPWVFDRHTTDGNQKFNRGEPMDGRLDGSYENRHNVLERYEEIAAGASFGLSAGDPDALKREIRCRWVDEHDKPPAYWSNETGWVRMRPKNDTRQWWVDRLRLRPEDTCGTGVPLGTPEEGE